MRHSKQRQKWKLWQKITVTVATIALLTGLGFLLFPTVSNFFGQQRANATIETFKESKQQIVPKDDKAVTDAPTAPTTAANPVISRIKSKSFKEARDNGEVDDDGYVIDEYGSRVSDAPVVFEYDLDALHRDSLAYNLSLINNQGTVDTTDYESAALDMSLYGLSNFYCFLSAPSIDLYLPVYLGANDAMMSCGAAHLSGTSLPIDQDNTNSAIAGHTDYIGRIFFDNIRKLDIGDTVTIDNYWETINYKVIDYRIVPPDDTSDIYIQEGRQLLTLITCIYAGDPENFDRYLVICEKENSF